MSETDHDAQELAVEDVDSATRLCGDRADVDSTVIPVGLLRRFIAAARRLAEAPVLWECPECAFGYDSIHTDAATGEHSCPLCKLAEVERERDINATALEQVRICTDGDQDTIDRLTRELEEARGKLCDSCGAKLTAAEIRSCIIRCMNCKWQR